VRLPRDPTALKIAAVYALLGVLGVSVTDAVLARFVSDQSTMIRLQVLKGGIFVAVSAVVIYVLAGRNIESLRASKADLERSNQQARILRRVLRHNVRNATNVIHGRTEMIVDETTDPRAREHAEAVLEAAEDLLSLTEESRLLRKVLSDEERPMRPIAVDELVRERVADLRGDYPDATITTDLTAGVDVIADEYLGVAVENLVQAMLEYAQGRSPDIRVTTERAGDAVCLRIFGDDTVVPDTERTALSDAPETPLSHAEGIGLRVAKEVVSQSGGDLTVCDEAEDAVVQIDLPAAA
jgi:light-regulated signal transduction histidine kinase (bacteriophytochrome)